MHRQLVIAMSIASMLFASACSDSGTTPLPEAGSETSPDQGVEQGVDQGDGPVPDTTSDQAVPDTRGDGVQPDGVRVDGSDGPRPDVGIDTGGDVGSDGPRPDVGVDGPRPDVGSDGTTPMLPAPSKITAGGDHSCYVSTTNQLYCWGRNEDGQLGLGDTRHRAVATRVASLSNVVGVSAGNRHTCAVLASGQLWCWGKGIGTGVGDTNAPRRVTDAALSVGASSVQAGPDHTCTIRRDGALYCWGQNTYGQLGVGDTNPRMRPTLVTGLTRNVTDVDIGTQQACAVVGGALFCWGRFRAQTPALISGFGSTVTAVDVDGFDICAIFLAGQERCWGSFATLPTRKGGSLTGATVSDVSVGKKYSCAITSSGAHCWETRGINMAALPSLVLANATAVSAGDDHICAIASGKVSCWGDNTYGQVGMGRLEYETTPQTVAAVSNIAQLAMAAEHTCSRNTSGAVSCWGRNGSFQLGNPTLAKTPPTYTPTALPIVTSNVTAIAAGYASTCVIHSGAGKCWGFLGMPTAQTVPTMGTGITAIGVGSRHRCFVQAGQAYCSQGLITSIPVAVPSATSMATVHVSKNIATSTNPLDRHVCGRSTINAVMCWGNNSHGQLGRTGASSGTAQAVAGLTNATRVAVGGAASCAIQGATLYCWGDNTYGQLGLGDTNRRSTATPLSLVAVREVAMGDDHTCAIAGSALYCWGRGHKGQRGDGSISATQSTAVRIFASGVTRLYASARSTCAIHSGVLKCWGDNHYGNLGVGPGSIVDPPTQVIGF